MTREFYDRYTLASCTVSGWFKRENHQAEQSSQRGVHSRARWLSYDPSECSELMVDSGRKRRQETGNYLPEGRY